MVLRGQVKKVPSLKICYRLSLKRIDIAISRRQEKLPQILCFFSYTMKPDASTKLSSTIDDVFDMARASF